MKWLIRLAVLAGALFLVWRFAVPAYAGERLRSAMIDAGVQENVAGCISGRMTRQLSTLQLLRLRELEGDKRTLRDWVEAVERMDDRDLVMVATASAALCSTGLGR
ncbi:hypothetical protein [Novosphingobium mangrovi (ex Huang et al. 2023)]|uniref:Uncharacterized protein n=1 Tax=Novosphingobium mangrovi (ex Huang et al. 2023) TaxID=2976432 RepID=A0ABT2I3P2_9SPHN|nr:hypothetical protein [Novosphingobium mangrovi (ex Huang et al. 2023)]MCT2399419.1 hypothetical protein [Novosphingobium mangrovi (ex Huang et al. 2023)]